MLSNKLRTVKSVLAHPLHADRRVASGLSLVAKMVSSFRTADSVPFKWVNGTQMLRGKSVTNGNDQWLFGLTEFRDMAFLLHFLRKGDRFCDVGANEGAFSILAGAVCGADILACEPVPATYSVLERNLALNGLGGKLVKCVQSAVGAEVATVQMAVQGRSTLTSVAVDGRGGEDLVDVPVQPLDHICSDLEKIDLLKVDVEGFEAAVVSGMSGLLGRGQPAAMIIELSGFGERYGYDERQTLADLIASGLTPIQYEPFSRTVEVLDIDDAMSMIGSADYSNCLLVRDVDQVKELVANASAFELFGRKV